jgi:hypothetical protein
MAGRRRAGQLVERFWPQIRALADALADHGGAMSAMQIAPFLAGIPKATPYARGDAPPVRSPQSPPPERARPAPPPSDLITRSAGFTPRVVLEIRHYGERIGDVIEIVPGKFMPWSRREERFVGGTFTDRHAAARML